MGDYKRRELEGNRISWTREDPYRTLGIGNPFNSIKEGDVIFKKSKGNFTWEVEGEKSFFSDIFKIWGVIIKVDRRKEGLYLEGVFFTSEHEYIETISWNKDLIKRLAGGNTRGFVICKICVPLSEWLHHFDIIKKEEWNIIKGVN